MAWTARYSLPTSSERHVQTYRNCWRSVSIAGLPMTCISVRQNRPQNNRSHDRRGNCCRIDRGVPRWWSRTMRMFSRYGSSWFRCGKRFVHDRPHDSTIYYGTIDVTADMIKAFRAKGGSASLKLGTAAVSISNTQRTIMMAALDGPVTEFPADLVPYIESLRHAGLIQWTATGYRITAQGRASLKWEHVIAPSARP